MKLTRRNTVIGIGTLAAGAGVIGGTGAFDQVQAQRDFSVGVADDDSAILALDAKDDSSITGTETSSSNSGKEILSISMNEQLNDEAKTIFLNAFQVLNNGTNKVDLSAKFLDGDGNEVSDPGVDFQVDDTNGNTAGNTDGDSLVNSPAVSLPTGQNLDVKIIVDTRTSENYDSSGLVNGGNYDQTEIDSVLIDASTADA